MRDFKALSPGKLTFALPVCLALTLAACGGNKTASHPQLYGSETAATPVTDTVAVDGPARTSTSPLAYAPAAQPTESANSADSTLSQADSTGDKEMTTILRHEANKSHGSADENNLSPESELFYYGSIDNEDSASAVDDAVWRLMDLAEEYHQMGVIANREASWEEAQYYFEKALKIMAGLDIEVDSVATPEASQYNALLENLISDYRVTMRSLGQLEGDVAPSVLVERFGDLEQNLFRDSLRVFGKQETEITYDLPIKINDRVKSSIIYFQTVAHDAFVKYLSRSRKYEPLYREVLSRHGLPQDLLYLSLVESGFNPRAYSWARASGLWQFIASTGRLYGLNRNWWVDERRDPVKSTDAAARFLKDLYKEFGDWELAMAAYNGGPGRVRGTIKKQGTVDFWKMKLRRQTMDYVPLIYAAAIIAKDPERYGFYDISFEPTVEWDEVTIDRCLELKVVAAEVGCSVDDLKDLNPELLRNYTPPNEKNYKLKIPKNSRHKFLAAYSSMPSPKETSWVRHEIRRGETISGIASRYGVSQYAIIEANNLSHKARIYAGKTIIVPVPLDREFAESKSRAPREYQAEGSVYTVRSGDTMWDIARAFGTSVDALRRINYIERGSRIYVGQKLRVPSDAAYVQKPATSSPRSYASADPTDAGGEPQGSPTAQSHKVRAGDTLWDIARRYGTTTSQLRSLNGLNRSSRIYPGQVLKVAGGSGDEFVSYRVRRGDSLGRIARVHGTSISKILAANSLTDPDNIQVGQVLRIKVR